MLIAKYAAKRALNMSLRAKFMAGVMSSYFLCLQNGDETYNAVSTYSSTQTSLPSYKVYGSTKNKNLTPRYGPCSSSPNSESRSDIVTECGEKTCKIKFLLVSKRK